MSNNGYEKNWSHKQLEAMTPCKENLLVSAGAGSGKTAVMIQRVIRLLFEKADLNRMLICTFTKTAAAEMKRKLSDAIIEYKDKIASGNIQDIKNNVVLDEVHKKLSLSEMNAILEEAQKKLPLSQISTLDSWCTHVIKNKFFISDLNPDFTVLEDSEEEALKVEICESLIAKECTEGDTVFSEFYNALFSKHSHASLLNAIITVYNYAMAQPYPEDWLALSAVRSDAEYRDLLFVPIKKDMDKLCEQAKNLLCDLGAAGFGEDYDALTDAIKEIESYSELTVQTPSLRCKPEFKDLHECYKSLVGAYRDLYKKKAAVYSTKQMPPHEISDCYCRKLGELALKLKELYGEVKRSRGKVDYSDLEHQTLKILNDPVYGKEVADGYDYVFVDEYQDISPLQEELLSKFNCTMFFVGDVKQSIYGFRMCRPDFFISKRDSYKGNVGKTISLNTNYRSGPAIIKAVNKVFENVMGKDFGGCDYAQEKIEVGASVPAVVEAYLLETPPKTEYVPGIYSAKGDGNPNKPAVVKEVNAVVNKILKILDEESKGDPEKAIAYSDIAVLVRSRGSFTDLLQSALRSQGIPVTFIASATSADSFITVATLINMLRLINNTRDEVSLASVLLSPMFGKFKPEELNELRRDGNFCDCIYGYYDGDPEIQKKLTEFNGMLNRFIRFAECSTVAELAGQITGECDCFNYAVCVGGEREAAALDAFVEYLAAADPDDLHTVIRQIDRTGVPKIKVGDGGNAVKIMTIHASKGLEFKHVILPNLHKRFNFDDLTDTVVCNEQEGIVLRAYNMKEGWIKTSPRFAVCVEQLKRATIQEEMRMLYVAMTRAVSGLYLFSYPVQKVHESENEISYIEWLYPYLFKEATVVQESQLPEPKNRQERTPIPQIVSELIANFNKNKSVKRESEPVKVTVSEIAHAADEPSVTLVSYGESAAERGTAYHKFMQWADFDNENSYEELCLKFPAEAEIVDREQIELAFKKVGEFIAGRRHVKEQQFVLTSGGPLIQGVIDLMVYSDDGSVDIVDYKTGAEQSVRNNAAYSKQLDLYAQAVQDVLKLKVNKKYLYSFTGGNFIEIK